MENLPASEFEIMQVIWSEEPPVSTNRIMLRLEGHKKWKQQTVLTLLTRLIGRGFLESQREGRERTYAPLITREDYLAFESAQFMEVYHHNSLSSLVSTLYQEKRLTQSDIDDLQKWLDERR